MFKNLVLALGVSSSESPDSTLDDSDAQTRHRLFGLEVTKYLQLANLV
jgi:hypothetical protein